MTSPPSGPGPALPRKVLVVDDSPSDQKLIAVALHEVDSEMKVVGVDSLVSARTEMAATQFDAVLLDLDLPDARELEALLALGALLPTTPIVVVTGYPADSFVYQALIHGADEYLNKSDLEPTKVKDMLLRATGRRLGRRRLHQFRSAESNTLNALPVSAVVLEKNGAIIEVNDSWTKFAHDNGGDDGRTGVGANYLTACNEAFGKYSSNASEIATGIKAVLDGERDSFVEDYLCLVDGEDHWFSVRAVALDQKGGGAVVTHVDVTDLRVAEEKIRARQANFMGERDASLQYFHHSSAQVFALADAQGNILHVSDATRDLVGEVVASDSDVPLLERVDPLDLEAARELFARIRATPFLSEQIVIRVIDRVDRQRTLDVTVTNLLDDPAVRAIAVSGTDVTERRYAMIASRVEERILSTLPVAVVVTDLRTTIVYWNERATEIFGYESDAVVGRTITDLKIEPGLTPAMETAIQLYGKWDGDFDAVRDDGVVLPVHATMERVEIPDIDFAGVVATLFDISERRELEHNLRHQALYDPLTDLPNRSFLLDQVELMLGQMKGGERFAILAIDFDDFKMVNDRFGHYFGDEVLRTWARMVREQIAPQDFLARLGADEFIICCLSADSVEAALVIAERVAALTSTPIEVNQQTVSFTATIGVALSTADSTAVGLLRNASLAMYTAKETGRAKIELFDDSYHDDLRARNELRIQLAQAVQNGEIYAQFQPEVSLQTGAIVGFEALARWNHKEQGSIRPDVFIQLAEESGLIGELGKSMLEASCRALREWNDVRPGHGLSVAVNVSTLQLEDPEFPAMVRDVCERHGIDTKNICLEVTESSLIDDRIAFHALNELKATGVRIALDDFGSGYSSLLRLHRYPLDFLKIDRSFVNELSLVKRDSVVVSAVLGIADALSMKTIGEGIESGLQWLRLREMGCETGQGFLFSQPLPLEEASRLVEENVSYVLRDYLE